MPSIQWRCPIENPLSLITECLFDTIYRALLYLSLKSVTNIAKENGLKFLMSIKFQYMVAVRYYLITLKMINKVYQKTFIV